MGSIEIARRFVQADVTIASGKSASAPLNISGYVMGTLRLPAGGLFGDLRYRLAHVATARSGHDLLLDETGAAITVAVAGGSRPRHLPIRPEAMVGRSLVIDMTTVTTGAKTISVYLNG